MNYNSLICTALYMMVLNSSVAYLLKVGKGLSKDKKARKLALQHWLEAVSYIPYRSTYNNTNKSNN